MIKKLLTRFCWYHNTGGLLPQQCRSLYSQLLRIIFDAFRVIQYTIPPSVSEYFTVRATFGRTDGRRFLYPGHSIGHTAHAIEFDDSHFILACSVI